MKKMTLIILTGLFALAGPAFSQTIPPYAAGDGDAPQSIPAPIDREKDTPCRPGCYAVEGGITGYYESGKYYNTDRTSTQYVQIRDSKAKKYAPWGIQLNPSAEFFLIKNVAVGGIAEFGYDKIHPDKIGSTRAERQTSIDNANRRLSELAKSKEDIEKRLSALGVVIPVYSKGKQ